MISKDCTITIDKGNASVDEDVYLYKNDMNIQILFTIVNNKYRYTKNTAIDNIIANNKASYAQVKFKKGDIEIDFEEQETKEGAVVLLIKKELIDEDTELGDYSIQIRLFDENKTSVITLPPVENCIHIQRPLFEKAGEDTNIVDQALTDMAVVTYAEPISATNSDGTYNKKTWVAKEKITTAELNRMEDGIAYNNTQYKEKANTQYVNEEIAKAQLEGAGVDTSNFIVNSDLTALENEVGFTRTRLDNLFISDFKTAHTGTWSGSQTAKTSNINKSTVSKEFLSGKYFCVINFDLNFNEELTSVSPYVKLNLKGSDFNNNIDLSNGGIIPSKYSLQQYNNNISLSFVTEFTETKNAWVSLSLVGLNESATRTYEANIHWATIIKVDDYNERYDSLVIDNNYLEQYVYVNDNGKISRLQGEVSELQKYIKNQNIVDYWGDSLTYGNQDGSGVTRATVLKQLLGDSWTVNNYGSGGETSNTIACRQGGIHLVVQPDFTIPETITAVSIDIVDSEGNSVNLRSSITDTTILDSVNPVEINGVKGNLGQGSTFGASPYTFTRLEAGDSVDVNRPTRVITKSMRELNNTNNVMIIWIGQNGGYDDVNTLISQINQMIKLNNTTNYLVISLTSGGKETINTVLNKEFGVKFIDARQYLIDYGLDDAGLTPTQKDLDNISNNLVPKSLLVDSDNVHFNKYGYTIIANLEYKRGKELGYW